MGETYWYYYNFTNRFNCLTGGFHYIGYRIQSSFFFRRISPWICSLACWVTELLYLTSHADLVVVPGLPQIALQIPAWEFKLKADRIKQFYLDDFFLLFYTCLLQIMPWQGKLKVQVQRIFHQQLTKFYLHQCK